MVSELSIFFLFYTPPPPDGHCAGGYASYWNAFLFCHFFCHKYSYEMDSLEAQCQMNICKREPDELCNGAFIAYCNLGK